MTEEAKRGSNGGNARNVKLSPERRREIAQAAAKKRWEKKKEIPQDPNITAVDTNALRDAGILVATTTTDEPQEKHCPACLAGESLEEGEGTHILATVEHPVTLPVAFQDAEASVVVPEPPPAHQKPAKRVSKPMPKELKTASSYAEKRLPQAIKEKADLLVEVARREAEIQELTRVIQALGGQAPVGIPSGPMASYPPAPQPYALPDPYPEYTQTAPVAPVVTPPRGMRAGGAAALDLGFLAQE